MWETFGEEIAEKPWKIADIDPLLHVLPGIPASREREAHSGITSVGLGEERVRRGPPDLASCGSATQRAARELVCVSR